EDGATRIAALWVRDGSRTPWASRNEMTEKQYVRAVKTFKAKGLHPRYLTVYPTAKAPRFAAIFGPGWSLARHDLTAARLHKACTVWRARGCAPVSLSAYPAGKGVRFAVVFVSDSSVMDWVVSPDLSGRQLQIQCDRFSARGYVPLALSGYASDGGCHYAA